ncbi:Type I inositol 1, 4, 5-trisphosphate 5-phosphatase [Sarcoptes scabiei]|uniref:inositol-polyphosphate 5-phosphatase n=1 Tax=Sarcoptes scabiei TaxID=52283 RepID=A0A834R707_SARSC|nr:Type I inositol 1, 4, 5-trisphosphate 5-phosphatase [Sarcoptes scabiei]
MTGFLLITANIGSLFHDPKNLLHSWVNEFFKTVIALQPRFIALHCQEFGGKNHRKSSSIADEFVNLLISNEVMKDFDKFKAFLDANYTSEDKFTALGNLYFIHKSIEASIWNFDNRTFVPVSGKETHYGQIESVSTKFKLKFPKEFFPECKWSRKGFMLTRWLIKGKIFDTINIHLFHDESNFLAISESPSTYVKYRRQALEYALKFFDNDVQNSFFIFGDFNFRLDCLSLVQNLTDDFKLNCKKNKNGEILQIVYQNQNDGAKLSIEKKHFSYSDRSFFLDLKNLEKLKQFDKELDHFGAKLFELDIKFPPSYPFDESLNIRDRYMNTRCPSWCDRIFMNNAARVCINNGKNIIYDIMGYNVTMGDHKPVYLFFDSCLLSTNKESPVDLSFYERPPKHSNPDA